MRVKSKSAVLHMLLGSPNYISGQELANRLGVSRQTVGKCVQQLREEGYKIEATQRLGYKFLGDNNLVTAEVLTPPAALPVGTHLLCYGGLHQHGGQAAAERRVSRQFFGGGR